MEMQVERSPLPAISKVYDVALKGDIPSFLKLLEEDPLILHRCIIENSGRIMQSPLHVAVNMGHSELIVEILNRMPELAEVVDQTSKSSPLHVASAKGNLEIVKSLVMVSPRMCLTQDLNGQNPSHVAAAKGQVDVLELLHHVNPHATHEKTINGETILHLCVKHNQFKALEILVELIDDKDDIDQLRNSKDNNGHTILHLAVTSKRHEMVEFLMAQSSIVKSAMDKTSHDSSNGHSQTSQHMGGAATRFYEATLKGDIACFLNLLEENPLIIEQCIVENSGRFMQSPLHVAANMGHSEIITKIIELNPSMCLAHDQDGKTPIHVAAAKGHVNVLELLHHANPHAAQETTNNGETILHLCVKHNQLKALEILLGLTNDDGDQLINSKDNNGNTVLHLAVTSKQPEMVDYLLGCPAIGKNARNKNEMTAVDIYLKQSGKGYGGEKIKQSLNCAKAVPAKDVLSREAEKIWLENQRSALMVVASLIATMAFQAGINPPGGDWQEGKVPVKENKYIDAMPGTAIWSYYADTTYRIILISNTIGLVSSLSVILVLISGLRFKRYFLTILRVILWISVTAISYTYLKVIGYMTESRNNIDVSIHAVKTSVYTWIGLMAIIFLGNTIRFIYKVIGWQRRHAIKEFCNNLWLTIREDNDDGNNSLDLEDHP